MVAGRVGSVAVKAVIDTGGMHTLGNAALLQALSSRRLLSGPSRMSSVIDATENLQIGNVNVAPLIALGNAMVRNTIIICGDFEIFRVWGLDDEPALLIGMDVLGTLAEVAIDYRRRELQLLTRGS